MMARSRESRSRGVFFFFSSRRRHTRLQGDWSSDVCSSDLASAMEQSQGGGDLADLAMVSVEMPLQYAVRDVRLYDELARPEARDELLKDKIGRASCRERV